MEELSRNKQQSQHSFGIFKLYRSGGGLSNANPSRGYSTQTLRSETSMKTMRRVSNISLLSKQKLQYGIGIKQRFYTITLQMMMGF